MANGIYELFKEGLLDGTLDLTGNIKVCLTDITAAYTVNLATDEFLNPAIAAGNQEALSPNLTGKSYTSGIFNAATVTFTSVSAGKDVSGALVLYIDTGTDTTSNLVAYIDTATGLPVTPNGGDITVTWDTGTNKIFKL